MAGATVAIVNPRSADGATGRRWHKTASLLHDGVGPFETVFTSGPDMATRPPMPPHEGASLIVAVGGDGTLNEVTNGFFDEAGQPVAPEAALGILPAGTGDFRFAQVLSSIPRAVRVLAGASRLVDAAAGDLPDAQRWAGVALLHQRCKLRGERSGGPLRQSLDQTARRKDLLCSGCFSARWWSTRDRQTRLQPDGGPWEEEGHHQLKDRQTASTAAGRAACGWRPRRRSTTESSR